MPLVPLTTDWTQTGHYGEAETGINQEPGGSYVVSGLKGGAAITDIGSLGVVMVGMVTVGNGSILDKPLLTMF